MAGFCIPRQEEPGLTLEDLEPESSVKLQQVGERLYAGNLLGAAQSPTDYAVISLCRTANLFENHRYHRQVFLIDKEGREANPDLKRVVMDTVNAIDQGLNAGLNVLVHCHGGRSRTALILKAWKMRKDLVSELAAHDWLLASWPIINRRNSTFYRFLHSEWPTIIQEDLSKGS